MDSNYTQIFKGNKIDALRIVDSLKEIGIIAVVKDHSESARLAGFGGLSAGPTEVHVHNDELERAEKVLEA